MFEIPVDVVCAEEFLPTYAHESHAGTDMRAVVEEPLTIQPGTSEWVGTGVSIEIPTGHVGLQFTTALASRKPCSVFTLEDVLGRAKALAGVRHG